MKKKIMIMTVLTVVMAAVCMIMSSCAKKEITCGLCNGTGEITITRITGTCDRCSGTGTDPRTHKICGKCRGKGKFQAVVGHEKCEQCGGTGKIKE
jgi:DnaJ-class molecular chaperone